ncbi:uncharacterized protein LOC130120019 [Lampris incognitus]|uniref:uncharacterized protein LOC130120019 n=1 Tax=Lampris incognitus TaxID=2546036 RepID=UPI0024B5F049|nr:uncharacterized protein LOC130120019 [Lampris incognitus]
MSVTLRMSAVQLGLVVILPLSWMAQCDQGSNGLVRKNTGESVTIHCRISQQEPEFLNLKRGLDRDVKVLYFHSTKEPTVKESFKYRLKVKGTLTKLDILITNLTVEDTGPYWCTYTAIDVNGTPTEVIGNGSVLLVMEAQQCDVPWWAHGAMRPLFLTCTLASAAVLLIIISVTFTWIVFKIKASYTVVRPRRTNGSDVYEDMRATLQR